MAIDFQGYLMYVTWWAATVWQFSKINTVYRFVTIILVFMHIGKVKICSTYGLMANTFNCSTSLSLIAGCAQMNKIYFTTLSPRLMQFQATTLKMWVNTTVNQWENQLNWIVTKRKFYTSTYRVRGPYFDIGVTHKCILVIHTSGW